jgi:hypothetical protein
MSQILGIAWFRPEQWTQLREVSSDSDQIDELYEDWLDYAEKQVKDLRARGFDPRKVDVDVDELLMWCKNKKLPVNIKTRSEYVAYKLQHDAKQY